MAWKLPPLALMLMLAGGTVPALAATGTPLPAAEAQAVTATVTPTVTIEPMPDAALPGAYCLAGATAAMAAAFAVGPTESLMILSGAMHLPSGTAVLFIPLLSILGGGACALGAASQPAVSWAIEQSDNIAARFIGAGPAGVGAESDPPAGTAPAGTGGQDNAGTAVRPLTEAETQSVGCIAGAVAGFGGALASSPMEVAMLSSGANTVVSSTPILALGLLGTIVASGCVIGTYAILPIQAFFNNFSNIGESFLGGLNQVGGLVSEGGNRALALLTGTAPAAVKVADGEAAR